LRDIQGLFKNASGQKISKHAYTKCGVNKKIKAFHIRRVETAGIFINAQTTLTNLKSSFLS